MISLLIAASLLVTPVQDTAHVVLVATTDLHGHMTGRDYVNENLSWKLVGERWIYHATDLSKSRISRSQIG